MDLISSQVRRRVIGQALIIIGPSIGQCADARSLRRGIDFVLFLPGYQPLIGRLPFFNESGSNIIGQLIGFGLVNRPLTQQVGNFCLGISPDITVFACRIERRARYDFLSFFNDGIKCKVRRAYSFAGNFP